MNIRMRKQRYGSFSDIKITLAITERSLRILHKNIETEGSVCISRINFALTQIYLYAVILKKINIVTHFGSDKCASLVNFL
jgi:hypothetical protein